jgi:CO dehydrogenase nickel-insertion accessory protein CooC1
LAIDIGVTHCFVVGNKVRGESDREYIRQNLPAELPIIGFLSTNSNAVEADMRGEAVFDTAPELVAEARQIVSAFDQSLTG